MSARSCTSLFVILFAASLSACDSSDPAPEIAGRWEGTVVFSQQENQTVTLNYAQVEVRERNGRVEGEGQLEQNVEVVREGLTDIATARGSVEISGTYDYPSVVLRFSRGDRVAQTLEGRVGEDGRVIEGTLEVTSLDGFYEAGSYDATFSRAG